MTKKSHSTKSSQRQNRRGGVNQFLESLAENRLFIAVCFVLVAVTVVMYYPNHTGDSDVWWHLKYGEIHVSEHTLTIDHSQFSWTPAASEWKYVTWIGSSALYIIHRYAGFAGLHIFQFVLLFAVALLFMSYVRSGGGRAGIGHAAFLLAAAVAMNPTAIYIKPELFTVLLFAVTVGAYHLSKTQTGGRDWFMLYPALFLVWVNTHGAFLIGLLFIVMSLAFEVLSYMTGRPEAFTRRRLVKYALFVGLSCVAVMINPHWFAYPYETVMRLVTGGKGYQQVILAYVNRWQFLFPETYVFRRTNAAWALVIMEGALIVVFVRAWLKKHVFDIPSVLLTLAFFLFAMKMSRATLYFPVIALFAGERVRRLGDLRTEGIMSFAPLFAVVLGFAVIIQNTLCINTHDVWLGRGIKERYPAAASKFISEHDLPAPIFNDYLSGGYLLYSLYPDYRVFIDPRHRPYEMTGVWGDYLKLRQRGVPDVLRQFTARYPARTAVVHLGRYPDIARMFAVSEDWRLVFTGPSAAVFVTEQFAAENGLEATPETVGASRFAALDNPDLLMGLFGLYAGIDVAGAREIMHIYRDNVSGLFARRDHQLNLMRGILAGR